ncbi:MAG: T9SS type A sorting domain-containing protein [Candidatus Kapabacteria bacterium]|nr:T9SS type A sorting domain-containing protein [Candidatus Kapabacteria bacterium]
MQRAKKRSNAPFGAVLAFLCVLLLSVSVLFAQDYLSVNDPQRGYRANGAIDEATLTIRPRGIYLEYGLFLTFSAKGTFLVGNPYSSYNVESVLNFTLPANSLVTDSWLWVGDSVMRAQIMDRWTASSIYEAIVSRRRDPSILTKNGSNNYELRVYPMLGGGTRKVKITYLVPMNWSATTVSAPLPMGLLRTSAVPLQKLTVLVWGQERWKAARVLENSTAKFSPVVDAANGNYVKTELAFLQSVPTALTIAFDAPLQNGVYVNFFQKGTEGFYQMAVVPSETFADRIQAKKIAMVLDFDPSKTTGVTFQQMLDGVKSTLLTNFSKRDSFNVIFSRLSVQRASPTWLPMDAKIIDQTFRTISLMALYSNLPALLAESVSATKGTDATVFLLSNSDQFTNSQNANQILKDVQALASPLPRIMIADVYNQYSYLYANGQYYYGNAYLYTNLARITGGSYAGIRSGSGTFDNVVSQTAQAVNNVSINSLDLYTTMKSGFCYGRYTLTQGGVATGSTSIGNTPVILQTGKFTGTAPFVVNMSGFVYSSPVTRSIELMPQQMDNGDPFGEQIWAGNYIRAMETSPSLPNAVISDIIAMSIKNRVLSNYTAFLALEPNDTLKPCTNCDIKSDIAPDGRAIAINTAVEDHSANVGVNFAASPNPFSSETTLEITLAESFRPELCTVSIVNVMGQEIFTFDTGSLSGEKKIRLRWSGETLGGGQAPTGMYFVVLKTPNGRMMWKLLRVS